MRPLLTICILLLGLCGGQALGKMPERPYRQRVYHVGVGAEKGSYESSVLKLPDPKAVVGVWKEEAPLAKLGPDDLEAREGCTVFLAKKAGYALVKTKDHPLGE